MSQNMYYCEENLVVNDRIFKQNFMYSGSTSHGNWFSLVPTVILYLFASFFSNLI